MAKPSEVIQLLVSNIDQVIHGKKDKINLLFSVWLAGGHALLEDLPGTGKTLLARSMAKVMGLDFKRVQFTPDLLPSDTLGGLILDPEKNELVLRKGPVFTSIFLGDEINRATPRTQSALLECMAERQVTIDGNALELDPLFFVMATQNPVEQHGTFPLPEAQLDRFMVRMSLGTPDRDSELRMLKERLGKNPIENIKASVSREDLIKLRSLVSKIKVHDSVYKYVLDLVEKSRKHKDLNMGASPRATLALVSLAQAKSLVDGEEFVSPGTVYKLFSHVMEHRFHLTPEAKFSGKTTEMIVKEVLDSVKTPVLK